MNLYKCVLFNVLKACRILCIMYWGRRWTWSSRKQAFGVHTEVRRVESGTMPHAGDTSGVLRVQGDEPRPASTVRVDELSSQRAQSVCYLRQRSQYGSWYSENAYIGNGFRVNLRFSDLYVQEFDANRIKIDKSGEAPDGGPQWFKRFKRFKRFKSIYSKGKEIIIYVNVLPATRLGLVEKCSAYVRPVSPRFWKPSGYHQRSRIGVTKCRLLIIWNKVVFELMKLCITKNVFT